MSETYKVARFNLNENTERGKQLLEILQNLQIPSEEIQASQLNQKIGYLAGLEGYEAQPGDYEGKAPDVEFMLMCNLPEELLDKFLDAMMAANLRINFKAVVTEYNREYKLGKLIQDIQFEHNLFMAWTELNQSVKKAAALAPVIFSKREGWIDLKLAVGTALTLLDKEHPTRQELVDAKKAIDKAYDIVTTV